MSLIPIGAKKRNLRLKHIDCGNTLTVGELMYWFKQEKIHEDSPLVLKIGSKNFCLIDFEIIQNKPVLIGR